MKILSQPLKTISVMTLFFFCWTLLPLYSLSAWAGEEKQEPVKNQQQEKERPEEGFAKAVEEINSNISKIAEKATKDKDVASEIELLRSSKAKIESLDLELKKEFAATEKRLTEANLPKEILDRHHKFVKHYEDNLQELKDNLTALEKAKTKAEARTIAGKTKEHLQKVSPPKKHTPLDPNKLPHRTFKAKERQPRLKKEEFEKEFSPQNKNNRPFAVSSATGLIPKQLLLAANGPLTGLVSELPTYQPENTILALNTADLPTADDLAETQEIQFTPELRQIATLLENNPVLLYEFVRNNFTYDPYYGSVRGSQSTLLLQSGNDFDQASVLIALFRASGIPARYAYGTVEIPIEKVMKWLGGITDPRTAGTILATNGIPAKLIISGSTIKSVQIEHAWTEVYIPYSNYRGLISDPTAPKTWIPLDPSFKLMEPNSNAMDLADAQQFDIDNYLASYLQTVRPTTPAKDYLTTTINYVTNNLAGQRFYDLLASGPIVDKVLELLPDTLPYPVKLVGTKFSTIPENYRHKITLEFADPGTNETVLSYTAYWANLLHNRFTISYVPATTTDEQTIANYGDIYSTPPYLIQVKPVLKVEGFTVAEGSAVGMAGDLIFTMSFIGPQGTIDNIITNNLTASATHAIGLGSGYTTGRIITNRAAKLQAAADNGETGESIIGEYLNLLAMNYLQELDSSRKLISKSMKISDTNRVAELMVGVDMGVSYLFGIPRTAGINGLLMDVDYNIATSMDMDGNQSKVRRFQILTGMTSSALEHTVFESIVGVEAVSTIKALEIANVQGIPVHQIDASNITAKLPLLQLSSGVKTDIQNTVQAGKVVTVSERNIQFNEWNGVGYIVLDPTTGAGAYMISKGISGGSLTEVTESFQNLVKAKYLTKEDAAKIIKHHRSLIWFPQPIDGNYERGFSDRHKGVDISAVNWTDVRAVANGKVTDAFYETGYGKVLYIDHGAGVETRYAHLCGFKVNIGDEVTEGQSIAYSGNTGRIDSVRFQTGSGTQDYIRCGTEAQFQAGAHLHFEILLNGTKVNPEEYGLRIQ